MQKTYLILLLLGFLNPMVAQPIISTLPSSPYVTSEHSLQNLEFDFIVTGDKSGKYYLDKIELKVYDKEGNIHQRKKVDTEGMVSGLGMFPRTKVKKDKSISLFNPFNVYPKDAQLHKLEYQFTFKKGKQIHMVTKEIFPTVYVQKTPLLIPISGRVFIDAGFDHYAHHRRMNTTHWGMRLLKIKQNITRYAMDFAHADTQGSIFRNSGKQRDDYYGFGKEVKAPGGGKVVEVVDGMPDNEIDGKLAYGTIAFIKNPRLASGNYIVIDHLNGEVSLLAHLKQGSIRVEVGQKVQAGDPLAQIGNSGDSTYPHLHFQLENEHSLNTQTFPAKFSGVQKLNMDEVSGLSVFCNTGDLIITEK